MSTDKKDRYISPSQQRILALLTALFGHEVRGIAPGELARQIGATAPEATRDLANLKYAGLAEQIDGGAWRLTPKLPQRAIAMLDRMKQAAERVEELRQRYTHIPH